MQTATALVDDVRLHVVEAGTGDPIVFVPGWLTTVEFWHGQVNRMAASHRALAFDSRGQGGSSRGETVSSVERRAQDLHGVLAQIGAREAVLVAWSMGVIDVLELVRQYGAERVRGLVLVDGPITTAGAAPAAIAGLLKTARQLQLDAAACLDGLMGGFCAQPQSAEARRGLRAALGRTATETATATIADILEFDYREELRALNRPVMYVSRDAKSRQAELFRQLRPGDRIEVFERCGHAMFLDQPDRFASVVLDFVGGLDHSTLTAAPSPPTAVDGDRSSEARRRQPTLAPAAVRGEGVNSAQAEGCEVIIDGGRLRYAACGDGPSIVFVAGWLCSSRFWRHQLTHCATRYRAIAFDPRSQGESSKTGDGNCASRRARDLRAVVDQLHAAPAIVVAWGSGGIDALDYLRQYGSSDVRGLILVDVPIATAAIGPGAASDVVRRAKSMRTDRVEHDRRFLRGLFVNGGEPSLGHELLQETLKAPTEMAIASALDAVDVDYAATLEALPLPTMFVEGSESPAWNGDAFRRARPGDRVERIEGSGSAMFLQQPAAFNRVLDSFVEAL